MQTRNKWNLLYHFVFGTKCKAEFLTQEIIGELAVIFSAKVKEWNGDLLIANGYKDHVHVLISLPPKIAPSLAVKHLKGYSSRLFPDIRWQRGYGCFTVSPDAAAHVVKYISNQKMHHEQELFRIQTSRI